MRVALLTLDIDPRWWCFGVSFEFGECGCYLCLDIGPLEFLLGVVKE